MMRIGIDIRNIGKKRTGDEVVFFNLVKNLALIDAENEYLLFTDIIDTTVLQNIVASLGIEEKKNFKIISLDSSNKFVWNIWTLPRYLQNNPVNIYQTQYITLWFVSKKTKIITTIHDISFNFYPQFIKFFDLLFLKTLIPISLRRADKIITVSKFTADEIIKYYKVKSEKVIWVHNAFSEDFLQEISQEEKNRIKEKYKLPEKFILYLGTMQPRKNLPTLIKAYAEIKEQIPEIKLVLAGSKNAYNFDESIKKVIEKYNLKSDVMFPGFINDTDKVCIYKTALCFCSPSFYEGFGIPILEAMASGVPVLASRIPPHEEIAEKSILFFEIDSQEDLKNKLREICLNESLREELRKKEGERAKEFSWQKSAAEIFRIYKDI